MIEFECFDCGKIKQLEKHDPIYQIKIITEDGGRHFMMTCSMECAEKAKKDNANMHLRRHNEVNSCSIQRFEITGLKRI